MVKWIISLSISFFSVAVFGNCGDYFDQINQKILARTLDRSLSGTNAQNTFMKEFQKLEEIDRLLIMKRLITLAGKDLKLADDFTMLLQRAYKENHFSQEEVKSILMGNTSERIVYDFLPDDGFVSYKLNVGKTHLKTLNEGLKQLSLSPSKKDNLHWVFLSHNFSDDNLKLVLQKMDETKIHETNPDLFESYLSHIKIKSSEEQAKYLLELGDLTKNPSEVSKEMKAFQNSMKKSANYEARAYKEAMKEADARFSEKSPFEKEEFAKGKAREKRNIYEHLSTGCKGKGGNADTKAAAKKFAKFKLILGTSNTIGAYTYFNWDKDKDLTWFSKLGYEVGISMIMSWVNSKIVTNPNAGLLKKMLMNYGSYAASDVFSAVGYAQLFGTSNKKIEKQFEDLKKDPDFQKKLAELHKFLEEQKVDQNFLENFNSNFSEFDFDPEKLTPEEIESPEMREALMEVMSNQIYEENAGSLLQTGSIGMDRYSFARLYGLYAVPKGIAVNLWIYHILCMSALNPKLAYMKATMIYMTDSLMNNAVYFKLRREAINQ